MKVQRYIAAIHWILQQGLVLQFQCLVVAVLFCWGGGSPVKVVEGIH